MVQRNTQGISALRQYLCHHAARISEATSVFYNFQVLRQYWTYLSKKRDSSEVRQFFGNDCLPITSIKPLNTMEVDYVLCHRMFPVTKRNLKKYPQQKGELLCSTQYIFLNLQKTLYLSDQVTDYNESWSFKNWCPSSLCSVYVRINIHIASHFTQGTWWESQTSYLNFKSLHYITYFIVTSPMGLFRNNYLNY